MIENPAPVMTATPGKVNLLDLDRCDLEAFFIASAKNPSRATPGHEVDLS